MGRGVVGDELAGSQLLRELCDRNISLQIIIRPRRSLKHFGGAATQNRTNWSSNQMITTRVHKASQLDNQIVRIPSCEFELRNLDRTNFESKYHLSSEFLNFSASSEFLSTSHRGSEGGGG